MCVYSEHELNRIVYDCKEVEKKMKKGNFSFTINNPFQVFTNTSIHNCLFFLWYTLPNDHLHNCLTCTNHHLFDFILFFLLRRNSIILISPQTKLKNYVHHFHSIKLRKERTNKEKKLKIYMKNPIFFGVISINCSVE